MILLRVAPIGLAMALQLVLRVTPLLPQVVMIATTTPIMIDALEMADVEETELTAIVSLHVKRPFRME
jgi:hypothetical protein